MEIQFLGAAQTVTGSCYFVKTAKSKFLIDCGMFQGNRILKEQNYGAFTFPVSSIDFVLLTHAHVDHSGLLPKLYKAGYGGTTYTTSATKQLCGVVLPDSGYIQENEVERKNRKLARTGSPLLSPIYTAQDARDCLRHFEGCPFDREIQVTPEIKVIFRNAGHILGAAIVEVMVWENNKETKIVFSGDIGNKDQALVRDPAVATGADYLIMESTYGNRRHIRFNNRVQLLAKTVVDTLARGGNVIIPSFAVERTQDMVYTLKILMDNGEIPRTDIYIDSPMAVEATKIFMEHPECFDDEATAEMEGAHAASLFEDKNIHYIRSVEESRAINTINGGAIIVSASGMCDAGRIKHHLKHNLWRSTSTILFVGYQASGTLGRRILEGDKMVNIHGEEIAVKAEIREISDFSAHADQQGLMQWLEACTKEKPAQVFLTHGEPEAIDTLKGRVEKLLGLPVIAPMHSDVHSLDTPIPAVAEKKAVSLPGQGDVAAVDDAFVAIREQLGKIAATPGKDRKALEKLLARVHEIEEELARANQN